MWHGPKKKKKIQGNEEASPKQVGFKMKLVEPQTNGASWTDWKILLDLAVSVPIFIGLSESHSVVYDSSQPHGLQPARLLCSCNPSGRNAGVGCHFLLQIFPTKGGNPGLLHCRQILYCLSHQRSPIFIGHCYFHLFMFYFWLRWVFVPLLGPSLGAASGGYSSLRCTRFSLRWHLL